MATFRSIGGQIGGGYDNIVVGTEQQIGIITINGTTHTLYRKVIDFGALPNATTKNVSSGLDLTKVKVVSLSGAATSNSSGYQSVLELSNMYTDTSYNVYMWLTMENIRIVTSVDRSMYTALITIEYYYI